MPKSVPVYSIENFRHFSPQHDFYAETIPAHLKLHHFTRKPHKHDFYVVVFFTKGSGTHEIDFNSYPVFPGALFLINPGQTHTWQLSEDIDGFIFFHTKDFFDSAYIHDQLRSFPFFASVHTKPLLSLKKQKQQICQLFEEIITEYSGKKSGKFQKLLSLVTILYIELARNYPENQQKKHAGYFTRFLEFERHVDRNFKSVKFPKEYAALMNISERHLNRICKMCFNKSPSDFITERVLLESKRLLVQSVQPINEIAGLLGYEDNSYFARLFKKHTGKTPTAFMLSYKYLNK